MNEKRREIGDTGMTVEELRAWAGLPGSGIALSHEYYVSILDALESAQREADEAKKRAERAEAQVAEMREIMRECADDLEGELNARYAQALVYPGERRKYERDMEPVRKARAVFFSSGNKALAVIEAASALLNYWRESGPCATAAADEIAIGALSKALADFEGCNNGLSG